ncbi:hypothetical protein CC80DRAFT_581194 [Byssothecium circinans]|uniref:PWWP domain-containing protein n=1 Tax=Byssothecium circinans TaxID=147558 RepID=A0A6A5T926_9PLEO|nr:hypothetical protein CC80DRAFT_581194 [Byssothecium circinans]
MAEETIAPAAVDATKPTEEASHSPEAAEGAVAVDAKTAGDGDVPLAETPVEEQAPETAAATDDQAAKTESADAQADPGPEENGGDAASTADASATTNGASAKKANNARRKSTGGVPEHKSKKTPNKKKKQPELHLDTKPGDMWFVAMRGYQPWPVIICDEDMLPETLLAKRPVSAIRVDGTYREDYLEGGKNVKDRRYPIMFLGTNEFAWQVNTDLSPFNMEDVKKEVESGNTSKKNKALSLAYEEAAEGHDLEYYKDMLKSHEAAMNEDAEMKAVKAEEKATKKEKASKRKSTAAVDSDVDMEDVDDAPTTGKRKGIKRKKEDESDGEPEKPAKTPKTKLKLNNKPPKDASAAKPKKESKKESKAKKAKVSDDEAEAAPAEAPQMTEEERRQKREKSVLYLRHRLQKGFLSRDAAPKDEDMPSMADYLKQLEDLNDLEADIIKTTKVHKVLKAIVKLNSIPKEEEFNFKTRSTNLLTKWNSALADPEAPAEASSAAAPTTNGVNHAEDKKTDETTPAKSEEPVATTEAVKAVDNDGDVPMADTNDETSAAKADEAPAAEAATA